jgi:hypothetical protein
MTRRLLVALILAVVPAAALAFAPDRSAPFLPDRGAGSSGVIPADPIRPGLPRLDLEGEEEVAPSGRDAQQPLAGPTPPVFYGDAALPVPVRETRNAIIAAATSGDPEALRPLLARSDPPTTLSPGEWGDPIDVLRSQAGDPEGREILAILLDVLDAGWVRENAGTTDERYLWPYFAAYPPDALDARQLVELFRLLTAADFEAMQAAGDYVFFRVEIAPDGRWTAFMSGE